MPFARSVCSILLVLLVLSACADTSSPSASSDDADARATVGSEPSSPQTSPAAESVVVQGSEPDIDPDIEGDDEQPSDEGDSDSRGDSDQGDDLPESPINSFLGLLQTSPSEAASRQAQEQEAVAACMRRRGFEYVPFVDNAPFALDAPDDLQFGDDEFVELYGFGLTTLRYPSDATEPQARGYSVESRQRWFEATMNPNDDFLATLGQGEVQAFNDALYAFPQGDSDATPGCIAEVRSSDDMQERLAGFYDTFEDDLAGIEARARADGRFLAKESAVEACISGKGYQSIRYLADLQTELNLSLIEAFDSLDQPYVDGNTERGMFSWRSQGDAPELSVEYKQALAEVQAYEIAVAAAHRDCGYDDQQRLLLEIVYEFEDQFLENNVDAIRAFQGDAG